MIHDRERLPFGLKSLNDCSVVHPRFDQFQRNSPSYGLSLLRQPHLAHPADAQSSQQAIRPDSLGFNPSVGYRRPPGIFRKPPGVCMSGEQRFNLHSQFAIVRAGFIQERTPLLRFPLQDSADNLFNLVPLLLFFHGFLFSSACSATLSPHSSLVLRSMRKYPTLRLSRRSPVLRKTTSRRCGPVVRPTWRER